MKPRAIACYWLTVLCAFALGRGCAGKPLPADPMRARADSDLRRLDWALAKYRSKFGRWPRNGEGLKALVNASAENGRRQQSLLASLPHDPWGRPYQYRFNPTLDRVTVWSLGEDLVNPADDIRHDRRAR